MKARSFYAELVARKGGTTNPSIIDAFRTVDRAQYVGPGPWPIATLDGAVETPDADEHYLYQDELVVLAADRSINNGQPSLHARCLAAVEPKPGERVIHVGTGTGYYTAILAHLVGPEGRVDGFEIVEELAAKSARNLTPLSTVTIHARSAVEGPLPQADVIYVSAGATHLPAVWLDALAEGGRLIFPLAGSQGGGMMLIKRLESQRYAASIVCAAFFIPCIGANDEAQSAALARAFATGKHAAVKSLRRSETPDETLWYGGEGWWFSTAEP